MANKFIFKVDGGQFVITDDVDIRIEKLRQLREELKFDRTQGGEWSFKLKSTGAVQSVPSSFAFADIIDDRTGLAFTSETELNTFLGVSLGFFFNPDGVQIDPTDFFIEVAKGNVPKHSLIVVLGRNADVDTTIVDMGMLDVNFTWLTVGTTLTAVSTDASDTLLGTGARTIEIDGLEAVTFDPITEIIEMDGTTTTVATTQSFIRINKTKVLTAGAYASTTVGANNGNISIIPSGGGAVQSYIADVEIDPGASQDFKYTVPNGYTAIVVGAGANIDSTKTGTMVFTIRPDADIITAPFSSKVSTINIAGFAGLHTVQRESLNFKLLAKTDMWASGVAGVNNTEMEVSARILLIED
jgi:hypothetical protein